MQNVLATSSSLWLNRLASSAVNRKVDGSNPSRDVLSSILPLRNIFNKKSHVTGQLFLPSIELEICKESVVSITWACTGIAPVTPRTQSENHTTRPANQYDCNRTKASKNFYSGKISAQYIFCLTCKSFSCSTES